MGSVSHEQVLIRKILTLPAEKRSAVEDFVDFLRQRDADRRLIQAAAILSEDSFRTVWDNDEDAAYDEL